MNKNNNKMDLLGNAPVPQALMALWYTDNDWYAY